ncbi:hypothetical protein M0Q97_13220 [Candidatus Dojkabacteria bacterium]|jgi:hypothetical protein|nr:hypothetical protein [Candidatus Dojkabacteria bacterium]
MRKKISDDKKRKKVSFSIDPDVYELWVKYCSENKIENYSEHIEKIIIEKLKK